MENELELISEILPKLFMGGTEDMDIVQYPKRLLDLSEREDFDSVVTCYSYAHPMSWYVHENRFGFSDGFLDQETIEKITELASWLYSEWMNGKKCLVRCQAGWNRSGVVLATILINHGLTAAEAISLIREKRSHHALNNPHFVGWLYEYEIERRSLISN